MLNVDKGDAVLLEHRLDVRLIFLRKDTRNKAVNGGDGDVASVVAAEGRMRRDNGGQRGGGGAEKLGEGGQEWPLRSRTRTNSEF